MFSRRAKVAPAPAPRQEVSRYAPDPGMVCLPDAPSNARLDAITGMTARQLQGHCGTVYGYDRGDPTHTLTGAIVGKQSPTDAQARIYASDKGVYKPPMTFQDTPGVDPLTDPYKAAAWARMVAQ
jgi:hypothetical protein